jgi:hypothetical protein
VLNLNNSSYHSGSSGGVTESYALVWVAVRCMREATRWPPPSYEPRRWGTSRRIERTEATNLLCSVHGRHITQAYMDLCVDKTKVLTKGIRRIILKVTYCEWKSTLADKIFAHKLNYYDSWRKLRIVFTKLWTQCWYKNCSFLLEVCMYGSKSFCDAYLQTSQTISFIKYVRSVLAFFTLNIDKIYFLILQWKNNLHLQI